MSESKASAAEKPNRTISLDTWAVLIALAAAVLIRFGLIQKIPW